MKVGLSLLALALGFVASLWLGNRLVRLRKGETREERFDRVVRAIVAALGCAVTALIVGVVWLQDNTRDTERAIEIALEATRQNCLDQQADVRTTEKGLIADVRLARAQYQASVDALLQIDERIQAPLPDGSALPVEVQEYVQHLVEDANERNQNERQRFIAAVERWDNELTTRERTLDEHRAIPIRACPTAEVETVEEPTGTT
jgi:hypothetical protein